jgi:hypothetical protein
MADKQIIQRGGRTGITITDYRDLIRELRTVDPAYARTLKANFKRVARPMRQGIAKAIPRQPPTSGVHIKDPRRTVSGFKPVVVPGRLSWGPNAQNGGIPAKHTVVEATKQQSWRKVKRLGELSIVRVSVDNAATVMADMAGRSRKWINKKPMTKPYLYSRGGTQGIRQHRINGQGKGMIAALDRGKGVAQNKASRWIWPTAEKHKEKVTIEVVVLLRNANKHLNERLKTR